MSAVLFSLCLAGFAGGAQAQTTASFEAREGGRLEITNGKIAIQDGSAVAVTAPSLPYELTFETRLPDASAGAPDYGIGQTWFSVDYKNETDRLAVAIRGGRLRDAIAYDFRQRGWTGPDSKYEWQSVSNAAFDYFFHRLGDKFVATDWFPVRVKVTKDGCAVAVAGQDVLTVERPLANGRPFALGGNWQQNQFRNVTVKPLEPGNSGLTIFTSRSTFSANAKKFDFGPAGQPAESGWTRANDAAFDSATGFGWQPQADGTRKRKTGPEIEKRLATLVVLGHEASKSTFRCALDKGAYVVTVGVGDAQYGQKTRVQSPSGVQYEAETPAGHWTEIRFRCDHPGGILEIPISGTEEVGASVCYMVIEPESEAGGLALSLPTEDPPLLKDSENRRVQQRAAYAPVTIPGDPAATDISLNGKWLFMPSQNAPQNPADPSVPDDNWNVIDVPSFWNPIGWWLYGQGKRQASRSFLYKELGRCESETFDWRHTRSAWYRQWLEIPQNAAGRRIVLDFDAVASQCVVYCNGKVAGSNTGMFKPFQVDITPFLKPGEKNLIALEVQSGAPAKKKAGADKAVEIAVTVVISEEMVSSLPRGGYFSPTDEDDKLLCDRQGGIWLDVKMHISGAVRLTDVWPRTEGQTLNVQTEIDAAAQGNADTQGLSIRHRLQSKDGKTILDQVVPITGTSSLGRFDNLPVENWAPGHPVLYTLETDLIRGNEVLDHDVRKVGFRSLAVADGKIVLNGRPWRMFGANMPPIGIFPDDPTVAKRFIGLMIESGQLATRTHCAATPTWVKEADEQGLAISYEGVWPWMCLEQTPIPNDTLLAAWKAEWLALVRSMRGHPSIVMWTIDNETYQLSDKDVARRKRKWDILQDIVRETRKLDPTRPIVLWSGYDKISFYPSWQQLSEPVEGTDFGDIDDRHNYTGTYTPSLLASHDILDKLIKANLTPDRPLMSQESATAYSDSDLGQQELGYMKTWHAQTWNGDQTYPYRNPAAFQTRLARITKEQIEKLRVSPVQGWFAFSTCTWYNITCNDPNPAGTIQPYPVHDAVGKALAPVLVMLDSSARNYFAGAKISAVVKAVDDRQSPPSPLTGLRLKTTLTAKNGSVLFDNTVPFPDMPQTQKPVDQSVELAIPDTLPDERTEAALHLSLLDGNGATVAQNDYDFTLCMPSYAKSSDSSSKNSPTTSASESASGTVLAQKPDDSQWPSLLRQAQDGATVIALDPVSLPEPLVSRGAKLVETDFNGECAHVTSPKGSPLLEGMEENDLAWWPASDGSFLAYKKAITFDHPLPDDIRPLVYHVPPHGYDGKWRMHFPVIRLQVGKGAVIISTLNFEGTSRDPLAARFYNNLIAHGK